MGTGYVGLVVGACRAETGNDVVCADGDRGKIDVDEPSASSYDRAWVAAAVTSFKREARMRAVQLVRRCVVAITPALFAFAFASCTDPASPPPAADTAAVAQDAAQLSRWLAKALGDRSVRLQLRDAMRASPITQHKLLLQAFFQTDAGQTIGNEIATANGVGAQQFETLVRSLPPFELLMPYREQRLKSTWDDPGMEVAALLEQHAPSVIAYDASGGMRTLTKDATNVRRPLVELRPERLWSRRMAVKPYVAGSVIQDADESEISGTLTTVLSSGRHETIELAELPARSPPFAMSTFAPGDARLRSSSRAPLAPSLFGTSDTTWLISIQVTYQSQDWNSTQDPYFNACYRLFPTQAGCTENAILRFYGLENGGFYGVPGPTYYPVAPLLVHRVTDNSTDQIEVTVRERDTLTGYGFYMGTWDINWENKIWADPFNGVFFYVDYSNPPTGPPCYKCLRAGLFSWEKAAPPPPPLAVTMTGPSSIRSNNQCTWAASVNGGVTPYTYAWKRNGTSVSTSSYYDGTGTTTFTLALTVTDHANSTSSVSKTVTISPTAVLCNQ